MTGPQDLPPPRVPRRADASLLPTASLVAVPVRKPRPTGAMGSRPAQKANPVAPPAGFDTVPASGDPAALVAWWQRLRRGSPYPSPEDLDADAIAAAWPEAVLLGYDRETQDIGRVSRLRKTDNLAIEYTPMVTEWLLALGRRAMRDGVPLHETRDFAGARGLTSYALTALPLSADRRGADHVLCRLGRT
jgi:hypothetical protein